MSETAMQLLKTFESLPPDEQHELLVAMARSSGMLPDTILGDHQLTCLADELFQQLDAEERNDADAQ